MKIAVITDLHYTKSKIEDCSNRVGERAPELLSAVIECLNAEIKPDIVLGLGDFINNDNEPELLKPLAEIFKRANCPSIAIPGNHDPKPEVFYQTFERPPEFIDIKGFRFMPFPDDEQTAGYNARKSPEALNRIKELSQEKPTILLQHVPLYMPRTIRCEYNYDNAEEIFASCGNVVLSVSGHEHAGAMPSFRSPFPIIIAPALCERNFPFVEIDLKETGKIDLLRLHYLG